MGDVYDRISWYEDNDEIYDIMVKRFKVLCKWLVAHNLVLPEYLDFYNPPSPDDFRLVRFDLTEEGQKLLDLYYDAWLGHPELGMKPLEEGLARI